ncbi:MAG: CopG family antitoxin [Luteolibacter sp.]|jgi:predicted DNA binding CopG/RHH family protein
MKSINNWSEIPEFADEEAEARFWEMHELDGKLMAASVLESDSRDSTTITLRFDPRMLSRLKRIARSRFLNYQSMMKQWLAERLEEEMRKQ